METAAELRDDDPPLVSLKELYVRVQKPDTPADVKKSTETTLELFEKKENYWMVNTMPDTPNARMIAEKTISMPWEQLYKDGKTLDNYEPIWMSKYGEAQLIQFLIRMQKAKQVLEIGMFTGYLTMAMAECLPHDGIVVACEIDPFLVVNARQEFDKSPFGKKIDIRQGPASESMDKLASEGQKFDLVYLDAEKEGYLGYFQKLLDKDLLAAGGTLVVDNSFGFGLAYTEPESNKIDEFNKAVMADKRVDQILLPFHDGVSLIRRKGE